MGIDDWKIVTGLTSDVDADLVADALAAAPAAVVDAGPMLPRRRSDARVCALCESTSDASREHIPPRSAGNEGSGWMHSGDDWLNRGEDGQMPGGQRYQNGVWGYVLCARCNSLTGRLSGGYREFAGRAASLLADHLPPVDVLNGEAQSRVVRCQFVDVRPGLFARQVMSHMISLAGAWCLARKHPELAAAVLDGGSCGVPAGLSMGMVLCPGPSGLTAGPTLHVDLENRRWRWIAVLAHPPLAFEFVLAASEPPPEDLTCCLNRFLEIDEAARGTVECDLLVGLVNTAFPGDWRTLRQVQEGRRFDGLEVDADPSD